MINLNYILRQALLLLMLSSAATNCSPDPNRGADRQTITKQNTPYINVPMDFKYSSYETPIDFDWLAHAKDQMLVVSFDKTSHYLRMINAQKNLELSRLSNPANLSSSTRKSELTDLVVLSTKPLAIYGGLDRNIYVYDFSNHKILKSIRACDDRGVQSLGLSADENFVYVGCSDATIRVFNLETSAMSQLIDTNPHSEVNIKYIAAFKADELIVAASKIKVSMWRRSDGRHIKSFRPEFDIDAIVTSKDGKYIAISSANYNNIKKPARVIVFKAETLETVADYTIDSDRSFEFSFHAFEWGYNPCLLVFGMKSTVTLMDVCSNTQMLEYYFDQQLVKEIRLSQGDEKLTVLTNRGWYFFDAQDWEL